MALEGYKTTRLKVLFAKPCNGFIKNQRVVIGGKNQRTRSLLGYHSQRENTEITEPSRQEILLIQQGLNKRLKQIIDGA